HAGGKLIARGEMLAAWGLLPGGGCVPTEGCNCDGRNFLWPSSAVESGILSALLQRQRWRLSRAAHQLQMAAVLNHAPPVWLRDQAGLRKGLRTGRKRMP